MEKIAEKRFHVIKPFLNKEKTLREIENETDISYATLKRWVKSYKDKGIEGLAVKVREDKDSFRKANDNVILKIEDIYIENKEKTLENIYKAVKENIEESISFNTFYRILSNLDSYLKNKSKFQITQKISNGEIYIIKSFISYHFVMHEECKKLPIILLAFNAATLDFIDFHIAFSNKFDQNIIAFLYKVILKGAEIYQTKSLPKEILIDSKFLINKKIKRDILENTNIKLLEFEASHDEVDQFIKYLKADLNKVFEEQTTYEKFEEFLENYSVYYTKNSEILLSEKDIKALECTLLPKFKRKVHIYGVRIHNTNYYSKVLEQYIGKIVDIIYYPLNNQEISVFYEGKWIDRIKLKK